MNKFKTIISIIFFIFVLVINLKSKQSDHIGTSTGKLMDIEVNSRVNGLGGAYCAYVNDMIGYEANIAGLAELKENQFVFSYYDWLADTSIWYGAFGTPVKDKWVMGTSLKLFNIPVFANKNEWGEDSGNINIGNFVYSLGIAYKYKPFLKFGVNLKYNRQSYSIDNSNLLSFSSIGLDIAIQYRISSIKIKKIPLIRKKPFEIKNLQLGLTLQNIGFSSSEDSLAQKLKFGVSYPFVKNFSFLFDINKEIYKFNSLLDSDYRFNIGMEYNYKQAFFVRGGVKLGYEMNSFTIGAGFQTRLGAFLSLVNYGYDSHSELGHINNVSFSTRFKKLSFDKPLSAEKKKLIEFHYYKGIAFFIEGKVEKAIVEWKKVLIIYPNHSETMEKIEEAQQLLEKEKNDVHEKKKDDLDQIIGYAD